MNILRTYAPIACLIGHLLLSTAVFADTSNSRKASSKVIEKWASFYALQLYHWEPDLIDHQLAKLSHYFTIHAWDAYHDALIKAHFTQQIRQMDLHVSAATSGPVTLVANRLLIPLTVRYENRTTSYQQDVLVGMKLAASNSLPYLIDAFDIHLQRQHTPQSRFKACPNTNRP